VLRRLDGVRALARKNVFCKPFAQAIERVFVPAGLRRRPELQERGDDGSLEQARIEIAKHRHRRSSCERARPTFRVVIFRDGLERIHAALGRREQRARVLISLRRPVRHERIERRRGLRSNGLIVARAGLEVARDLRAESVRSVVLSAGLVA
jgi:hypothetical protein